LPDGRRYVAERAAGLHGTDATSLALSEQRLLLTEDKDFGDLVFRRGYKVPGIVLLRFGSERTEVQAMRLTVAIERYGEGLFGRCLVVESDRFRSRPLPNPK
jgi:predicted nuclease of predicted toxin-antitoxin system